MLSWFEEPEEAAQHQLSSYTEEHLKKRHLGRNHVPHTPTRQFQPKIALLTTPVSRAWGDGKGRDAAT